MSAAFESLTARSFCSASLLHVQQAPRELLVCALLFQLFPPAPRLLVPVRSRTLRRASFLLPTPPRARPTPEGAGGGAARAQDRVGPAVGRHAHRPGRPELRRALPATQSKEEAVDTFC